MDMNINTETFIPKNKSDGNKDKSIIAIVEMKPYVPCPFCGSKHLSVETEIEYDCSWIDVYHVKCNTCKARGPANSYEELAIICWNQRTISQSEINHKVMP